MNILIADDHGIVRQGLQHVIETQPGWHVAAQAASADEVLPLLRREDIDVVVLILSMHDEEQYALRCLRAGASGYVQKERSATELIAAIRRVAGGHTYVSPAVADQLTAELVRGPAGLPHERLSTREFEVFRLVAVGKSIAEIAEALHLSVNTVSTYRSRICSKAGFRSNAELISYAIRNGLV
jgi:DNA-binding NarL/FixJ family response regulator